MAQTGIIAARISFASRTTVTDRKELRDMPVNDQVMNAVVYSEYGAPEVLHVKAVEKPVPGDKEVLIKVHATSVNYGDLLARNFKSVSTKEFNMPMLFWFFARLFFGFRKPKVKILGSEFSGVIKSVGKSVKSFKPGDQVFGYLGQNMGAYAEYLRMPETGTLILKPENMNFDEAAVVSYGAIMALHLLAKADIREGHKVLINGASGSIGSAAVQIAKNYGAEVTGVCGPSGLEVVKNLGADAVINYREQDFTKNNRTYDLIFDVLGKTSFTACKKALNPNGRYFRVSFKMRELFQMLTTAITGGKRVICAIAPGSRKDLQSVKALIEAGKLRVIIDKRFPLEQAAEAHRHAISGSKKGSVVITVAS